MKVCLKKLLSEHLVLLRKLSESPRNLPSEHFPYTILRLAPDFVIVHVMGYRQLCTAVARGATAQAPAGKVLI